VLELGLERDAQLRRFGVDRCEANASGQQAHPASACVSSAYLCNDSDVRRLAPALRVDAHTGCLKDLDGPEAGWRGIPECHVQPMPELVLVFGTEGSESEQVV
jgi:hypothetical protein